MFSVILCSLPSRLLVSLLLLLLLLQYRLGGWRVVGGVLWGFVVSAPAVSHCFGSAPAVSPGRSRVVGVFLFGFLLGLLLLLLWLLLLRVWLWCLRWYR